MALVANAVLLMIGHVVAKVPARFADWLCKVGGEFFGCDSMGVCIFMVVAVLGVAFGG
jgi:hypothetical protein